MDGWAVLSQLRQIADPPPVLLMTALANYSALQRAMREGAAALISKPFRFQELVATSQKLLSVADGGRPAPEGGGVRRVPRRVLMVEVSVLSREGAPFFRGQLVDVSSAGARIDLDFPLADGDTVRVALRRPGSDVLALQGRVQWRVPGPHGFSHGLAFKDLSPEEERRLGDLLG